MAASGTLSDMELRTGLREVRRRPYDRQTPLTDTATRAEDTGAEMAAAAAAAVAREVVEPPLAVPFPVVPWWPFPAWLPLAWLTTEERELSLDSSAGR